MILHNIFVIEKSKAPKLSLKVMYNFLGHQYVGGKHSKKCGRTLEYPTTQNVYPVSADTGYGSHLNSIYSSSEHLHKNSLLVIFWPGNPLEMVKKKLNDISWHAFLIQTQAHAITFGL